jgi:hypothetical protein
VVLGQPHLALATTCGSHDMQHTGFARLLAISIVIIGRGFNLLKTLLVPLPVALRSLHGILDGDIERCHPVVARDRAKLGHLIASSTLGGDTAQLLGGVPGGIGRCLER